MLDAWPVSAAVGRQATVSRKGRGIGPAPPRYGRCVRSHAGRGSLTVPMNKAACVRPPISDATPDEQAPAQAVWCRPASLLVVVAVVHALSPLLLLGSHWWYGYDETVYLSQINAHLPAGLFSAPRARGPTLLAAPVTMLSWSVSAVRIWVAALSGLACYLAFRPWLRLRPGYLVPLAALLFSTIWTVIYYGFEVMPNEWVAFGLLAATGWALRYLLEGSRAQLGYVAVALALVALLRPSDAAYGGAALLLSCVVVRSVDRRRRLRVGAAVVVGIAVGCAQWVLEAYARFGGPGARIVAAQAEQGGGGLHFAGAAQFRTLAGPILCRAGCHASAAIVYRLWWIGLVLLVIVALFVGARRRELTVNAAPAAVGLAIAAQYVFTVTYAAPRFLIPTYGLLCLPAAAGLRYIVCGIRGRRRRRACSLALAGLLLAHAVVQVQLITSRIGPSMRTGNDRTLADARDLVWLGVRPGCIVSGPGDENLAYAVRCTNVPTTASAIRHELDEGAQVVWLVRPPADRATFWRRVALRYPTADHSHFVYLSFVPLHRRTSTVTRSAVSRP